MAEIHPTAIVGEGLRAGKGVKIGPYCTVGSEVVLGDNVDLRSHVIVSGRTTIGAGTVVYPFASIGEAPQDMSYRDEPTETVIGEKCTIREQVTIHRGTERGKKRTTVGDNCFLMVGSHVAHDCVLGNNVTMVNHATIGGHVEIGDFAILGGLSAVQQRIRIGTSAFVGGHSGIGGDLIPFGIGVGRGARLGGLNIVGLKRRGFDRPTIHAIRAAYRTLFLGVIGSLSERLDQVAGEYADVPAVMQIVTFIRAGDGTALCVPRDENGD
jgi:UDP-N-acetylglucosamine acyltransferase